MVEQPTPLGDYEPIKKKKKKGLRINAPLVSRSSEQGAYDCCTLYLPLRPEEAAWYKYLGRIAQNAASERQCHEALATGRSFSIFLYRHTVISHFSISFNMQSDASAVADQGCNADNDNHSPVDGVSDGTGPQCGSSPASSSSASLTCPECGQTFHRREHVIRHLDRHSGRRSYTCHLCKTAFSRRYAFSLP
jgi:hypothetical protein